jgi:hypothetical protein
LLSTSEDPFFWLDPVLMIYSPCPKEFLFIEDFLDDCSLSLFAEFKAASLLKAEKAEVV